MVCEVNGIIEFYAHAIPYLASTRKKGLTADNDETVSIIFPEISIDNKLKGRTFLLKENLRIPRGPDS
jgi:hypothetical protein